jgi:hypothetical protein
LNSEASQISLPCASIFNDNSSSLLGPKAWCDVQQRTLTITVPPTSSIKPGQRISLSDTQGALVDMLMPNATFTGGVTITTCQVCQQPSIVVNGPKVR